VQGKSKNAASAFKSNPDAIMITDFASGRIVGVNSGFEKLFGYSRDELVGRTTLELGIYQDSTDRERLFEILGKAGTVQDVMLRCRNRAGMPLRVLFSGEVSALEASRHCLSVWEDIAVREMAEKKWDDVRQAQKMEALGMLAGGTAHDFNNILTTIMLNVQLAGLEAANAVAVRKHLAEAYAASKRAAELVGRILTFSRKQEVERKPIRLQPVIEESIRLIQASLPATIGIDATIDPLAPWVLADANQIQQVMANLCGNAAHAMRDSHGRLTLRLEVVELSDSEIEKLPDLRPGIHVRITVADSGGGMDEETLKHIFEPFFTTKAPGEGTGLGLAIVYGIVKEHEGAVTVHSQPGVGTTFTLYFPGRTWVTPSLVEPSINRAALGEGERLLYVDDEPSICAAIGEYLGRMGYTVTTRSDPREALELVRNAPDSFDVVITDLTMAGLTGLELARQILSLRPAMPIILVSGALGAEVAETARAIGIHRILPKPLEAALLAQAINQLNQAAPCEK
jgi:PAS domain S-box-containing protein